MMGLYSNWIFPMFYDHMVDLDEMNAHRESLLKDTSGLVLEVGIGTGLNFPYFPDSVTEIHGIEPNLKMGDQLMKKIETCSIPFHLHNETAENLSFKDETFDCVVSTICLCSVKDQKRSLNEIFRVLKPDGKLFFMEHGLSPDPKISKWQFRLNPIQKIVGVGCILTQEIIQPLKDVGFQIESWDEYYLEQVPKTHGYMFQGVAVK